LHELSAGVAKPTARMRAVKNCMMEVKEVDPEGRQGRK